MALRLGTGYKGSPSIQTSAANQDIIPTAPSHWTVGYNFYKFSFNNPNQPCTVKINNGEPIFIDTGMGFNMDQIDSPIRSFIIVESGIDFYWIGAHQ